MKALILSLLAIFAATLVENPLAHASDDYDVINYDGIISELSSTRSRAQSRTSDPLSEVTIHGGVGFVTSHLTLKGADGKTETGFLQGAEAVLGIDLLSPQWVAEGAVRSFGEEQFQKSAVSLKEFDLRIIYRPYNRGRLRYRLGFGLAARYLEYRGLDEDSPFATQYTTPSSLFLAGADLYITRVFSIATEFGLRTAMVSDTSDKTSIDAGIKLNGHF